MNGHPPRRWLVALVIAAALPPAAAAEPTVVPSETCRGLFFVSIGVGPEEGTPLELLLDTGSACNLVDPGALRRVLGRGTGAGRVSFASVRAGDPRPSG